MPSDPSPRLSLAQRRALVDALLEIPIMAHRDTRQAALSQLSYAAAVPEHSVASIELHQVVITALDYPHGMAELIDVVSQLMGDTARSVVRLRELAEALGLPTWEADQR